MNHVVLFSGGVGSWCAAKRVAAEHGTENLTLLFTDTLMEDEDLYRFLEEGAENVGGDLVKIADGRTPWEVFFDVRFLGNHRIDPCSRILKRELGRDWLEEEHDPDSTTVYLGIDWTEEHRLARSQRYWKPYAVRAPMCDPPYLSKAAMLDMLRSEGIEPPRLYALGFPHNNCGGFCIKAGHAHFRLLWETMPERFLEHERREQELREHLGRDDIAILTDRSGGRSGEERRPITLREFRERLEADETDQLDMLEWGGCGCMSDYADEELTDE